MSDPKAVASGETKLRIAQIFLENAQFRHRGDALLEPPNKPISSTEVELGLDLRTAEDQKSVAVRLRVESNAPDAPYLYSAACVVIFTIEGPMPETDQLLVTGGTIAMPFVREVVANLSMRGRHGPTWLAPVNFSEIVRKNREEAISQSP